MKSNRITILGALFLGAVALSEFWLRPASATTVNMTYMGIVTQGLDATGLFGSAQSNLGGLAYTAVYTFNPELGTTSNSPTDNSAFGGTGFGVPSPSLNAVLTINGHSAFFSGGFAGEFSGTNTGIFSQISEFVRDLSTVGGLTDNELIHSISNQTATLPASLTLPFMHVVTSDDFVAGSNFVIRVIDQNNNLVAGANGLLAPSMVSVEVVSETPLPTALPLFVSGLGGLGLLGWRRKKRAANLAA